MSGFIGKRGQIIPFYAHKLLSNSELIFLWKYIYLHGKFKVILLLHVRGTVHMCVSKVSLSVGMPFMETY